jgi:hypothetical protein
MKCISTLETGSAERWVVLSGSLFYHVFSVYIASLTGRQVNDEQTRRNNHALSGIRIHGVSVHEIRTYASDRAATGTGQMDGENDVMRTQMGITNHSTAKFIVGLIG